MKLYTNVTITENNAYLKVFNLISFAQNFNNTLNLCGKMYFIKPRFKFYYFLEAFKSIFDYNSIIMVFRNKQIVFIVKRDG